MDSHAEKDGLQADEHVETVSKPQLAPAEDNQDVNEDEAIYWDMATWINMGALCFVYFASTFTVTVPPAAIAYIVAKYPTEAASSAWIATAMTTVSTIIILPLGEFIDIFGRKKALLVALAIAFAGAMLVARANSIKMAIIGQALDGVGLATGYLVQPIIYEIVPKRHRPLTGAITGLTAGTGFIIAPIVEGVCIKKAYGGPLDGWRTGMYIGAALYGAAFILLLVGYSPTPRVLGQGLTVYQRLAKMDWLAIFFLAGGLSLFLSGLGIGGNLHPWKSATTICLLVIGFLLLVATGVRLRYKKDGLLPHSLFQHRNFPTALVVRATGSFAQLGCQAFLPQVIVYLFEDDGILQAVWGLPFSCGLIVGALIAAGLFWWTKEGRWIAMAAMGTLAIGAGSMTVINAHKSFIQFMWPPLVMGASVGIESQVLNIIAGLATPDEYIATAISAASLAATFGSSIGITICSQIFTSKLKVLLPSYVGKAALAAGLPADSLPSLLTAMATGDTASYDKIPGMTPQVLAVIPEASKDAYAKSFTYIWYALLAFAIATMAVTFCFKTTKPHMTTKVSSPVKDSLMTRMAHRHGHFDTEKADHSVSQSDGIVNEDTQTAFEPKDSSKPETSL